VNFTMGVTHFNNSMDEVIASSRPAGSTRAGSSPIDAAVPGDEAYRLFAAREATKVILDPRS